MGRRARLKKQAKIERLLEARQEIEVRKVAARSPIIRLVKRFLVVLVITVALLYLGQTINDKIAKAENEIEVTK